MPSNDGWVTVGVEVLLSLVVLAAACAIPHPTLGAADLPPASDPATVDWDTPGPIEAEVVISARWAVPRSGVLDLTHPEAAGFEDVEVPIVLPVVRLRHPAGTFVIDTGIDADLARGGDGAARFPLKGYLENLEPVVGLATIIEGEPLRAVLLTHAHADHVLGLPDVPAGVPVWLGPGELDGRSVMNLAMGPTYRAVFDGVDLRELAPSDAVPLDLAGAPALGWDLIGDGSLWALSTPGHTAGSLAFVARTVDGPLLVTGDSSHTRWGWDHDVPPGTFTEEPEAGKASLALLRRFAAAHPTMRIQVGHEAE